jgi:hypothetical protein
MNAPPIGSRIGVLACSAFALAVAISPAAAHIPEPKVNRELVRLQGYRATRPEGAKVVAEIDLNVFGVEQHFFLTEWQQFGFSAEARGPEPPPPRLALQGDRATLARVGEARAGQRVTILAEHRPASNDLFILAADLCPEK